VPTALTLAICMGHAPAFQRLQTTQGPKDLSQWRAKKEILPQSKMPSAPAMVLLADSCYSPQFLLIRPKKLAPPEMGATYLAV